MNSSFTMKKCISFVLALIMCFSLSACTKPDDSGKTNGSNNAAAEPGKSDRTDVVYCLTSDIASFDPTYTSEQISVIMYRQLYDTLVTKDENGNWVGKLAESWKISEDECTYTFYLRKDVVCHDGQKMTSKDVAYSINNLIQSKSYGTGMVNMVDCVEIDDYTVELHLSSPYEPTLNVLLGYGAIASANNTDYDTNPIGTGPYKYVSRNSGDNIKLKAWDQYYLGEAAIKDLTFKIITDSTTQIAALQKGEIDFLTHCPLNAKGTVEGDSDLVWNETIFRGNTWAVMCQNKPPFDNILARKAVQYGIDKEALLLAGSEGLGKTMKTVFPATINASPENDYKPSYKYDLEIARDYLEKYKAETGTSEVNITILAPDTAMYLNPAIAFEGMMRDVGFTVTTQQIDRATFWASIYSRNFQISVNGTSWPTADCDSNYIYWHSKPSQNFTGINVAEVDKNFDLGRNSTDENVRIEAYANAQKAMDEDAAVVPLYQPVNAVAYSAALKGVDTENDIYAHFVYDWSW